MRNHIIQMIENELLNRKRYYTREQEIQISLAFLFETSGMFDRVILEQHISAGMIPGYPWTEDKNIYVDIILQKDGRYYPIELKYKTKRQAIPLSVMGSREQLYLGQQGAQSIGCYDFWKDVKRLELYEEHFQYAEQGIQLFVTNDEAYLKPPLNLNAGYGQFSIHEGKAISPPVTLDWNRALSISRNRPPIRLNRVYNISWKAMQLKNHFFVVL